MAVLDLRSFDNRTADFENDFTSTGGVGNLNATPSRTGNGLRIGTGAGGNFYARQTFSSTRATLILGAFCVYANITTGNQFFRFVDGSTVQIGLRLNADRTLSIVRGDGTVLATSSSTQILSASGNYIEWKVTCHNTAGAFEVRVDGVSWLSGSGVNTRNSSNNQMDGWDVAHQTVSQTGMTIDDLYVCDTLGGLHDDFLGAVKVEISRPTAAGNSTQWTPNTGANWAAVDDATPDDDTTYITSSTANNTDLFTMGNLSAASGNVIAVQVGYRGKKTDLSTRSVRPVLRVNSQNYPQTVQQLTGSYVEYRVVVSLNPNTSAAWSVSDINNLEAGMLLYA